MAATDPEFSAPGVTSATPAFESKAATVARALRQAIIDGEYAAGQSLRQRDIAQKFGISATPVREAFSQLQAEGYVEAKLHHGVVVRGAHERISENWRLRAALESVGAELATIKAKPADLDRIRTAAEAFATASPEDANARNVEFHFTIYQVADSPVLMRFLTELWGALDVAPTSRRAHELSVIEHSAIIDAIERGDARSAAEYTRLHINGTAPRDS